MLFEHDNRNICDSNINSCYFFVKGRYKETLTKYGEA